MTRSRVTLAQWQMLAAVVDHGGFARAAEVIHKSPSTINHAVHKLSEQLGVQLLETRGRRVVPTEAGSMLLRRARQLLEGAEAIESVAGSLARGLEAEIALAVDQIFPHQALFQALSAFSHDYIHPRIQLHECVLNGGVELLQAGRADLLISGVSVPGFLGEPLTRVRFMAVAHPGHALHQLGRELDLRDLRHYRQIVIRDSAQYQSSDHGWLRAEQRWTVSHVATALEMLVEGMGFAWVSETRLHHYFETGQLRPLPLRAGAVREVPLQLYFRDADGAGPAARALAQSLRESVEACPALQRQVTGHDDTASVSLERHSAT
ncbi:LysR family transcriptional regulator [Kushneria phosphatilytica]|uniref:LysR family transcriptional regulator n=1 Tax=Kushneria phosphatilytica TaxID=657387 RepID=A0A1S1NYI3_9GAMM|nr:LysR family transcriptional regulator [Kushneria phosphatilytica]OHV12833.1 LysR family transcriptional regulator [Kushneria phosphatilytica]QEL10682.1 LysR family transcriptional regulator [Kushneria phosphatilytica]